MNKRQFDIIMESAKKVLLTDSFDSKPASWTIANRQESQTVYKFSIGEYTFAVFCVLSMKKDGFANVSFGLFDPKKNEVVYDMTNTGNQFLVLATVADTIKHFIDDRQPPGIIFTASKKIIAGKDSKSRPAVYLRMLKKYIPKNWSIETKDTGHEVKFLASPQ